MWPRPGNWAPPEAQTVRKGFSGAVQRGRAADTSIGPQEIPSLSAPDPQGHTSGLLPATQFALGAEYPSQMPGLVGTAPTPRRLWAQRSPPPASGHRAPKPWGRPLDGGVWPIGVQAECRGHVITRHLTPFSRSGDTMTQRSTGLLTFQPHFGPHPAASANSPGRPTSRPLSCFLFWTSSGWAPRLGQLTSPTRHSLLHPPARAH